MKNTKNTANQIAKECLVTALIQLLKEKNLSEITISELTNKAGVSRMTYYRNYTTKEDIFTRHLQDIFAAYRQEFYEQDCHTEFFDMPNMLHCFQYFSIHKEFLNTLFAGGMGQLFLTELSDYILSMWYHDSDSIERYYTLQAFAGSLYNVYLSCFADSSSPSGEELAKIIYKIYS
ncbi:TetR/AcrR family transcriptional regulator [Muricomes intestini]|uniref:TetR family transcriptional regulator n=1 Tax=Muricomes intestini TaxID=1796634 RepID=A0A4R3JZY2_9FIRM|nr:TetR/AcrR family transcriptional regulator [Muricomes intestini]TCS75017.1 TetR family transcriptional regulator [Muricomes intestini]